MHNMCLNIGVIHICKIINIFLTESGVNIVKAKNATFLYNRRILKVESMVMDHESPNAQTKVKVN